MDKNIIDTIIVIAVLVVAIRWWSRTKGTPYRRDILLMGISWIITVVSYILSMSFKLGLFFPIGFIAFAASWFFYIKALLAERKYKKQSFHD